MATETKQNETLKVGCRTNSTDKTEKKVTFDNLFDAEWEVFVIKKDKTGKLVGRLACCALAPVC
jgi:hypothetical protein